MHSFIIFEQDVEEVLGMLLPDILHSEIARANAMGWVECVQRPGVFLAGAYPWLASMDVSFAWARTPAWGRPYIPFRILKNTQPSGVTYCYKLYSCMNSSGICDVWTRRFSKSFKFVFR